MTHGWDAQRRTFVQYFGTDALDAGNLIMPLVFFISPNDPRMIGTLNRTMAELVSDSLVHRYEIGRGAGDGLTGRDVQHVYILAGGGVDARRSSGGGALHF